MDAEKNINGHLESKIKDISELIFRDRTSIIFAFVCAIVFAIAVFEWIVWLACCSKFQKCLRISIINMILFPLLTLSVVLLAASLGNTYPKETEEFIDYIFFIFSFVFGWMITLPSMLCDIACYLQIVAMNTMT